MVKLKSYWLLEGVEDCMPNILLKSDTCLLVLVKKAKDLDKKAKIREFF